MGLGRKLSVEEISNPTSWFGVSRVLAHNEATKPQDELKRFSGLFDREPPKDMAQVAAHYQQWLRSAVEAWQCNEAGEADIRLINWLLKNEVLSNDRESNDESDITQLVDRYRQVEQQLKTPQTINGMADLEDGFDYHLNIRGDYDLLGDQVPRGYLQTLTGKNEGFKSAGSGRLELAELIASPENPLTARVFVNRVWHWLFGSGIVATPNNFGKLGQTPTHPHLLDYLATRFVDEGWSVKRLVRMIVLSETWRQGSEASPQADLKDPDNRLLHHYSLRRLEAEAVRDAILATSGGINLQLYGPPVDPPRVNEDPQKRLVSGPIDGNGRRSLYTKITIMEPPQFLAVFNQPQPKIPTGKRDVSNTPLQSLALLNDNFVNGEAGHWAKTVVVAGHASVEARLEQMFLRSLGRLPTAGEIERWNAAVREIGALHDVSPGRELASELLWKDIAHALFNTKEFIYIR
jgi:hypothetical protein